MFSTLARVSLVLLLAAAVLWLALPAAASGLARAAVTAAGFEGDDVEVSTLADPPLKLLLLEADAVRVRAGRSSWRGVTMERVDVTVFGVRLGSPPGNIDGRLDGVTFPGGSGDPMGASSVSLSGSASTPDVTVELATADLESLIGRSLPADLGRVITVFPAPPDGLLIRTGGGELRAQLVVTENGGLALVLRGLGSATLRVTLLDPGAVAPVQLRSVAVEGGRLMVRGTVDAGALGLWVVP